MASEHTFVFVILIIVAVMAAIILISNSRQRIKRLILDRFNFSPRSGQTKPRNREQAIVDDGSGAMTAEESKAELERLQKLIEDRKKIARDSDLSHHLWGLYTSLLRYISPQSSDRYIQDGEWYDVKILQVNTRHGLNKIGFELKGARYQFVDDEDNQGWADHSKHFNMYLYDESDRCLIEIPMKVKVDKEGRKYSISSGGPNAFLPGDWVNDFINVKLKHQSIRNQEIRAQKHKERLSEIEDLKNRFGIAD